jgi:hypothetical protein
MAALTANRPTDKGNVDGQVLASRIAIPIADNVHIYQGALVQCDTNGRAIPAATGQSGPIMGRAYREYDNTVTGHVVAALTVEVEQGVFTWDIDAGSPPVQASTGLVCYALDDHTISLSNAGTRASAGRVLGLITVNELGNQVLVQTIAGIA